MTTPRHRWLFLPLVAAILVGIAWPALATVAQEATPAATPAGVTAQDGVEPLTTATIVPGDAPVYVAATLDRDSGQWQLAEDLIRRAGLGDLLDQALDEAASEVTLAEASDLDTLLTGEVALVVADLDLMTGAAGLTPEPPDTPTTSATDPTAPAGFAVLLAPRDPDAAEALALEAAADDARARDIALDEIEQQGATITVVPGGEFEDGSAVVRLGDVIVFSATAEDLTPFIEVFAGNSTSLAESDEFGAVRQELPDDFLVYGFVNGRQIRLDLEEAFAAVADAGTGFAQMGMMEQALVGLDTYSGFAVRADDPGFRFDTIAIPADGAMLPPVPANFDAALPERVPADSLLLVNSYDLGATVGPQLDLMAATFLQIAEEDPTFPIEFPPGATEEERIAGVWEFVTRFLTFNPRTDLVGQLVEEWGLAVSVRPDDPNPVSAVFVSGVDDEVRVNDAVTKLAVWVNLLTLVLVGTSPDGEEVLLGPNPAGARTVEVNGALTQVIDVPVPELGVTVHLQWGVLDGELVFGVGDGFGEYAAGPDGSLASNPRYQAVMAELPAEHFGAFYLDLGRVIELAMPLIEQELESARAFDTTGTPAAVELPDLSAIQALAAVAFERDGAYGTSAILYIAS